MKQKTYLSAIFITLSMIASTGCQKRVTDSWNDGITSSIQDKFGQNLWGVEDQVAANQEDYLGPVEEEFVPLQEEDLKGQFADGAIPQSKRSPGEIGSGLPGIDQFRFPTAALAAIFRTVHFNTDDHILRDKEAVAVIERVATYLKSHSNTYVFVEGHCDQRAPEAYNLALGSRRANYIRSLLVQKGVDPSQVHTVSYGKEFPVDSRNTPEAWNKNRRAQFRIYEK